MGLRFTQNTIATFTCPNGQKDKIVFDDTLAGFGCRITAGGTKTFLVQYNRGDVKRRMPIGTFGSGLTVKQARDKAQIILGRVRDGRDPFGERKAETAQIEANVAAAKIKAAEDAFTFRALIEAWERDRTKAGRRQGYLGPATASLRRHFKAWLERPAGGITEAEAARRIEQIETEAGPKASNRALAYARAAYARGVKRALVETNPFIRVEPVSGENSRDRVLNETEIGAVWRAAASLPPPYSAFVKVLMLTGQRRNEVAGMRWDELSADLATWVLPGSRTKNNEGHVVALAEPAREILQAQPRLQDCPYVFPGERHKPVCAFSLAKRLIDSAIKQERTEAKLKPVEFQPWVLHDFRRSMATWMASAGIASDVADRILNHREGKTAGVKGVYQRYQFLPERHKALEAWAAFVVAAGEGRRQANNVVLLAKAG